MEKLLAAIGKDNVVGSKRIALETELQEIRIAYLKRREQRSSGTYNRLLRRFRAYTAKRRELREQLGPIYPDIVIAGYLRSYPDADASELRAAVRTSVDPEESEVIEDRNIAAYLDSADDYRKRWVRKQAVEPFLRFLERQGVTPSRKLPRNRMMKALFDWLNVEPGVRPTPSGIRTIARDLKKRCR
jgi:hypothetical protein